MMKLFTVNNKGITYIDRNGSTRKFTFERKARGQFLEGWGISNDFVFEDLDLDREVVLKRAGIPDRGGRFPYCESREEILKIIKVLDILARSVGLRKPNWFVRAFMPFLPAKFLRKYYNLVVDIKKTNPKFNFKI